MISSSSFTSLTSSSNLNSSEIFLNSVSVFELTKLKLLQKREILNKLTLQEKEKEVLILRELYSNLLSSSNLTPLPEKMLQLRKLVIEKGLPDETEEEKEHFSTKCSLRAKIWKILLGALKLDAEYYTQLVLMGPCSDDKKIRNDTFRTYKNNNEFWSRVDESKLSRVLTVCSRSMSEKSVSISPTSPSSIKLQQSSSSSPSSTASVAQYVQGMNVLAAPFLFLMPEVDAYYAFMTLITRHCPRYIASNLDGTHHGCSLVDRVLEILDPELHQHIIEKTLLPEIFAFQFIMTLLANMSPLTEVIKVWDVIFAFGIHIDILLVTCHIMLMRNEILAEQQAFRIQKMIVQEPLDSQLLIGCTLQMVKFIPGSLFEELISHPVDKPRDISQVLSREFNYTTRSIDEEEQSVSSQTRSKTIKKSVRPLSGRLKKSRTPSLIERGESPTMESKNNKISSTNSSTHQELSTTTSTTTTLTSTTRGMIRSISNGRSKLRTRSRSRSRGKTRLGTSTSTSTNDGSGTGGGNNLESNQKSEVNIPIRRPRVNSTSRVISDKSSTLTSPLKNCEKDTDSSTFHPHHTTITPGKSPNIIARPKSPHSTLSPWR